MTGVTGFLGSHLLRRFVGDGHRVVCLARPTSKSWRIGDLLDRVRIYRAENGGLELPFREHAVGTIVHCATTYGRKEVDPIELLDANLILPLRLLQLGRKHGVGCFINTDTILDRRVNHYTLSKSQFKEWLRVYSSDMVCVNVALEHFYGPFDDGSKFVAFIVRSLLRGDARIDLTAGEQKRDFIFIDDVVEAFARIHDHARGLAAGFYDYQIGTRQPISIRDFVLLVQRLTGNDATRLNFGALPYRENEVMETRVDDSAIRRLGWVPRFPLEAGILETIRAERRGAGR